jgi:hypothetical protein
MMKKSTVAKLRCASYPRLHRYSFHRCWTVSPIFLLLQTGSHENAKTSDVKNIIGDDALMDAIVPQARKAYNLEQMTIVDTPAGGKASDPL